LKEILNPRLTCLTFPIGLEMVGDLLSETIRESFKQLGQSLYKENHFSKLTFYRLRIQISCCVVSLFDHIFTLVLKFA